MAVITPNSEVRLLKNVPFSNNYRNVIYFKTRNEQYNYFNNLPSIRIDNFKYVRNNGGLKVPYYRDELLEYNYLMFKNKAYGDKWFYAFITNYTYINPNTCLLNFELDVFQSWFLDVRFQPSYIEREHCQLWNSDGSPVINTVPEELDYGSEYEVKGIDSSYSKDSKSLLTWFVLKVALDEEDFVPGSTVSTTSFWISQNSYINEGLMTLVIPYMPDMVLELITTGTSDNDVQSQYLSIDIILSYFKNTRLVNKLKNLYVIDYAPFDYTFDVNTRTIHTGDDIHYFNLNISSEEGVYPDAYFPFYACSLTRQYETQEISLNGMRQLKTLTNYSESKLLMYPYSYFELTDFRGDNFIIKPQYLTDDINKLKIKVYSSLGQSNKIAYIITNYLVKNGIINDDLYLSNGIINAEPSRISFIDDYTSAFLQGNMNTIEQSISATRMQSILNNRISGNNARTNSVVTDIQNASNLAQTGINGITGFLAMPPNMALGSGIGNMINAGIQASANENITDVQNANMLNNTRLRGELNNQLTIQANNAKIQDTRNMPDNVTLQGGDTIFNYGYHNKGCNIIYKTITPEYASILTDYFQKYGYKVHRTKLPNLTTRKSWNYVHTIGCNIIGNIPDDFIHALENIFNNGITLWHTTDVGNYNLNNDVV